MAKRQSPLRRLRDELGGNEQVAARLNELGQEVTGDQVAEKIRKGMLPVAWRDALGFDPDEYRRGDTEPPEPGDASPKAKVASQPVPDELDWRNAKEAIVAIYVTIGEGVARVRKRPAIAEAFKMGAPILADDWIALAKVDARVRGAINKLMVVGPGGKLAMDHLILVGKIATLEKPDATRLPGPSEFGVTDDQAQANGHAAGDVGAVRPVA